MGTACSTWRTSLLLHRFDIDWNWRAANPEVLHAIQKVEKDYADKRVERSLYQRPVGYSYDAVKIFSTPTGIVEVPNRERLALRFEGGAKVYRSW